MAINTLSNTSSQEVRLAAANTILSGELVALTEGNNVYPCSTALSIAGHNITTAGPSAAVSWALVAPTTTGYQQFQEPLNSVLLGNEAIAFAFAGDGTTNTTNVNVSYLSEGFGAYQPSTVVATDTTVASVRILKLTATTFVVGWLASSTLKFRIYNNDGTAVTAATTASSSIATNSVLVWNFAVTANSDIVFVYRKITSNDTAFTRYNSSGTIQGTETIVEAGATADRPVVLGHSNGDFWIYYRRTAATTGYKFARYNSSGVLQGALTVLNTANVTATQNWGQQIVQLGNGSVLMWAINASSFPDGYIYDSSGVLVASNTTWHSSPTLLSNRVPAVFVESSRFTVGAQRQSGGGFTIRTFNNVFGSINAAITTTQTFGNITGATGYHTQWLFSDGSAGWTIYQNGNNGTTSNGYILSVSPSGATLGSLVTLYSASGGAFCVGGHAFRTGQGLLSFTDYFSAAQINGGLYNTSRRSIIGVAIENAAVNATFRCATSGTFEITNSPLSPGYWDARTATPGGCRGTTAGTTAILSGTV